MFRKPKHEIPSLEDVQFNTLYALSFNPVDKLQYFKTPVCYRISYFKKEIDKLLIAISAKVEYSIEVSAKGRLHIHGTIQIQDAAFYLHDVVRLIQNGTLIIKPIDDLHKWLCYCDKQQKILHKYLIMNRVTNYSHRDEGADSLERLTESPHGDWSPKGGTNLPKDEGNPLDYKL